MKLLGAMYIVPLVNVVLQESLSGPADVSSCLVVR